MQHKLTFNVTIDYSHVEGEDAPFSDARPMLEQAVEAARCHGTLSGDDVCAEEIKVFSLAPLSTQRQAFHVTVTYEPLEGDMLDTRRLTSFFVSALDSMRLNGALTSPFYAAENLSVKVGSHEVSVQHCLCDQTLFVDINNIVLVKDNVKEGDRNASFRSLPFKGEVTLGYSVMFKDSDGNMLPASFS